MDIYKITGVLILITSICYLIVAILSLALVLGKKNLVKQNLSFTVMAGLIMPCFEAALFCAGTFMFTRIIAGEWKVPLIAALFMMAYCFISVFNYLYLRNLFANVEKLMEMNRKEAASHINLIDNISHDIRNPMNTIVGMTEVIKKDPAISKTHGDNIAALSDATLSLLGVVSNIMDYTKIQCGKLDIIPTEYATDDLLNIIIDKAEYANKESNVDFVYV